MPPERASPIFRACCDARCGPVRAAGPVLAAVLSLMLVAAPALGAEVATGIVVDAQGHPVRGAEVGSSFTLGESSGTTRVQIRYSDPPVRTDSRGAFSIPAAPIAYTHVLVAAGQDGTLGFALRTESAPTRIVLERPALLDVTINKPFGHPVPAFGAELMFLGSVVGYAAVSHGHGKLLVPPGVLQIAVSEEESVTATEALRLAPGKPAAISVRLQPTRWARNLGKPAPGLFPTDSRNWRPGESLAALRGKWVLVSFWATWCLPCVREMPALMAFYDKHARARRRFEIIAVHSPDGASFAAIRSAYDRLVKVWGQAPPFPLLFDATGRTVQAWGIQTYPTTLLIDPSGRLSGAATLDDLRARLGMPPSSRAQAP